MACCSCKSGAAAMLHCFACTVAGQCVLLKRHTMMLKGQHNTRSARRRASAASATAWMRRRAGTSAALQRHMWRGVPLNPAQYITYARCAHQGRRKRGGPANQPLVVAVPVCAPCKQADIGTWQSTGLAWQSRTVSQLVTRHLTSRRVPGALRRWTRGRSSSWRRCTSCCGHWLCV